MIELYPAATSLLPVSVTLANFLENHSLWQLSFLGGAQEFPSWYLGAPYSFLTGPVYPLILIFAKQLFGSYFSASLWLVLLCQLLAGLGTGLLTIKLIRLGWPNRKKGQLWLPFLIGFSLIILNPWLWVSGFGLTEGSRILGWAFLPWGLSSGITYLEKPAKKNLVLSLIWLSLLTLTNNQAFFVVLVGLALWAGIKGWQTAKRQKNEAGDWESRFNWEYLKQISFAVLGAWFFSLIWYGPLYWLNLIFSGASIGGRPLFQSILWVVDLLKLTLPAILAVWALTKWSQIKNRAQLWIIAWLSGWGFLSLIRFLADWDFWQDWSQYGIELSMGVALGLGVGFQLLRQEKIKILGICLIGIFILGWIFTLTNHFWWPRTSLNGALETKAASWVKVIESKCQDPSGCGTWFFSGTPVFWINALYPDVRQLRGGVDQGSTNKNWRDWAWILRESQNSEEIKKALSQSGIKYILVHTNISKEYYHDFKNIEVWPNLATPIKADQGEILYQVNN